VRCLDAATKEVDVANSSSRKPPAQVPISYSTGQGSRDFSARPPRKRHLANTSFPARRNVRWAQRSWLAAAAVISFLLPNSGNP